MQLEDPAPSFGCDRSPFYFCHVLKSWGFESLLILANSASTDVGLIGADSTKLENWEALEAYQFTMPLDDEQDDTWPISTALDLCSDQVLPSLTPDQPPMPSCPILWVLNNKGMLMACDVLSTSTLEKGIQYPSMVKEASGASTLNTNSIAVDKKENTKIPVSIGQPAFKAAPMFAPVQPPKEPAVAPFNFSGVPKPSVSKVSSGNIATSESKSISSVKKEAEVANKSLSILLTHFNKAYQDFQFDISKLSTFFSDLNLLAQSDATSSLSDLANFSKKAKTLEEELDLMHNSLVKIDDDFDLLKSQLLHTWAKKEESDRRLKILKSANPNVVGETNPTLGPEAEELGKILNRKTKVIPSFNFKRIESSISDLNQVLEDLREKVDAQKRGKKLIG